MNFVSVLYGCGKGTEAYNTCCTVLSELGEKMPQSFDITETKNIFEATSKMAKNISETSLLEMKEMNERLSISLKFYSMMADICFTFNQKMFPFLVCRMVQVRFCITDDC